MKWIITWILWIGTVTACVALTGCAGYKINDDGSATSWGFLRTLTVQHEYYPDGKLKTRSLSTQSNTADVMMGANELLKTGVDTAAKLKP